MNNEYIMDTLDINTVKAIRHLVAGRLHTLRNSPRSVTQIIKRDTPVVLESKLKDDSRVNLQEMLFITLLIRDKKTTSSTLILK